MRINGLTLNVAKTQVLQVGASQEHILFLGQKSIEKQSCVTCLRVSIDEKLAFTDQIHEFVKRTYKHLSVTARLRHMVGRFFLLRYYNVYVKSVIHYGFLDYALTSKTHPKPVFSLQKNPTTQRLQITKIEYWRNVRESWSSFHIWFVYRRIAHVDNTCHA